MVSSDFIRTFLVCIYNDVGPESCGIIAPPLVVSVSYGEQEWQITASSATRQCNEYGKLGLMGTTILYSSGDNGVAGLGGQCLDSSGMITGLGVLVFIAYRVL